MPAGEARPPAARWLTAASVLLVAAQAALPWSVPVYVTQDGASHVYNAHAAWQVLFGSGSLYTAVYAINPLPVPNWTVTVLLWAATAIAGVAHAEQLVASFVVLAAYAALTGAMRWFAPGGRAASPLVNALLSSWFLYLGFYNFYLGAALAVAWVAYVASRREIGRRELAAVGAGAVVLYFTHLVAWAAALVGAAVILIGHRRELAKVAAAVMPTVVLAAWYLLGNSAPPARPVALDIPTVVGGALAVAYHGPANQTVVTVMILLAVLFALISRRLRTTPGARWVFAVAAVFAALTLLVPGAAAGGSFIRERMWWFALAFGVAGALAVLETSRDRVIAEVVVTVALAASLVHIRHLAGEAGHAAAQAREVWRNVPAGARVLKAIRMNPENVPMPVVRNLRLDPLMHSEALPAAELGAIDLSDYAAAKGYFPLVYRRDVFSREAVERVAGLEVAAPGDLERAAAALPFKPESVFDLEYPNPPATTFAVRVVVRGVEVARRELKSVP